MIRDLLHWLNNYQDIFVAIGITSLVLFALSLILMPLFILWLPADYFIRHLKPSVRKGSKIKWILSLTMNLFAAIILALGLVLLVLPGPGWFTILAGLALLDLPIKYKIEMKILSAPALRKAIDQHRKKHNREPIIYPDPGLSDTDKS
jgi:archaellum biogenesis protein FlaJ (TadC family)